MIVDKVHQKYFNHYFITQVTLIKSLNQSIAVRHNARISEEKISPTIRVSTNQKLKTNHQRLHHYHIH